MSKPPPAPPFTRADLARARRELMRDGRWANARVERVTIDGVAWTLKDFSPRSPWVRNTIGSLLARRELRALRRLDGLPGVPAQAFRVDAHATAARYLPGTLLGKLSPGRVTTPFLLAYEALLKNIHDRGIVHLDTGGGSNMLMLEDGSPGIVDFQAALSTRFMPRRLRLLLEGIDLRGLYKKWLAWEPQTLGEQRHALLAKMLRRRRLWFVRGYFGVSKKHRPGSHGLGA